MVITLNNAFHFKKKYGQNFLNDENIVERIARSASILENSLVIEVGPGKGILTKYLAQFATHVLCYEVDLELQTYLEKNLEVYSNVDVLYQDFLDASVLTDLARYDYQHLYFVSNVPYYITTPILMKLMQLPIRFSGIVMMVQKEVGDRFCAKPGCRDYGSLSVFLHYFFDVEKLFLVSRKHFVPVPNVDSVVVSFVPRKEKLYVYQLDSFFQLVRDSFQFKRKTLRNNLKQYDLDIISEVLKRYHYDLSVRAEDLDVLIFVEISNALFKK